MILPTKYILPESSLLFIGSQLLRKLKNPMPPDRLWSLVRKKESIATYERFVYALDFLYMNGLIDLDQGLLTRRNNDAHQS